MKVLRSGFMRFHSWETIIHEREAEPQWNAKRKQVDINFCGEPDINGKCHYNYCIILDLHDIAQLIDTIANFSLEDAPSEVRDSLKPQLASLVKLATCALGYVPRKIATHKAGLTGTA